MTVWTKTSMRHMDCITGWLGSSVRWYWIVVLCSLMTTGFVIPAFLAFSFSQTETERQLNIGLKLIHAKFETCWNTWFQPSPFSSSNLVVFKVFTVIVIGHQSEDKGLLSSARERREESDIKTNGARGSTCVSRYHTSSLDLRLLKMKTVLME